MTSIALKSRLKLNLWKTPILGPLVFACWKFDAARKLRWMEDWIPFMGSHIEIGSGPGSVLDVMRAENYDIDGLDIADNSYREDLRPVLYNGKDMPFCHHAYDTALLPTILHHTPDPDAIILEALRIARRVIIIEDVYEGRMETFEQLELSVQHRAIYRIGGIFKQAVYVLEPRKAL